MSRARGRMGEDYGAALLQSKGYTLLAQNYASRYGEVDLIVCDATYLCFVEVKTRRQNSMVTGAESVTKSKQRKIIATALHYMQQYPTELQPRFDVLSIVTDNEGAVVSHDYLTGAFDSEAYFNRQVGI